MTHAEEIAAELLNVQSIKDAVGQVSLAELPQGTEYPALVYQVISTNPLDYICLHGKNNTARLQINPLARNMGKINEIHNLVKKEITRFAPSHVAGCRLVSCTFFGFGPISKDDKGMMTKPGDYRIIWEDLPE